MPPEVMMRSARTAPSRDKGSTDELRDVVGYESFYKVSRDGRVFRVSTYAGRPCFKPVAVKRGRYLTVHLSRDGAAETLTLHSVVAEAWVGIRPAERECAHLDGNSDNNSVGNLAWVTHLENEEMKKRHGTWTPKGEAHASSKVSFAIVEKMRAEYKRRAVTAKMLGAKYGLSKNHVLKILRKEVRVGS